MTRKNKVPPGCLSPKAITESSLSGVSMGGVVLWKNLGMVHVSTPLRQELQRETSHLAAASEMVAVVIRNSS